MGQCISGGSAGRGAESLIGPSPTTTTAQDLSLSGSDPSLSHPLPSSTSSQSRKNKKIKTRRLISIKKNRQKQSQTSLSKEIEIFNPSSSFDMKETDRSTEKIAQETIVHITTPRSRRRVSQSDLSNKGLLKSVTFLEPELLELENGSSGETSYRKTKRLKSNKKSQSTNENKSPENIVVSKNRVFRFRKSKIISSTSNPQPCYASNLQSAAATVLSNAELQITRTDEKLNGASELNGVDFHDNNSSSPLHDQRQPVKDNTGKMGISFSDDNENLTGHKRSVKSNQILERVDSSNGGAITNSVYSTEPSGSKSLTRTYNTNFFEANNINNNSNNNYNAPCSSPSEEVKSPDVIREELRLRRLLFFNSGTRDSDLLPQTGESDSQDNLNMNGGGDIKATRFGYRQPTQRKLVSSTSQHTVTKFESNIVRTATSARQAEMNLPKLYSVHNIQPQRHNLKSQGQPSKQPSSSSYSSGNVLKANVIGSAKNNNNLNRKNNIYPQGPNQGFEATEQTDSLAAEQWTSGPDVFQHQKHGSIKSNIADVRRETMPAKFGYVGTKAGLPAPGGDKRQLIPDATKNDEIRRGSIYSNFGSRLPTYNSGVQKPVETVPFYMMNLYKSRNSQSPPSKRLEGKPASPRSGAGFSGVSTGVVKQRTIQYQSKISEQSTTTTSSNSPNTPPSPLLVRSSTYVKSTSPLAPGSKTPIIDSIERAPRSYSKSESREDSGSSTGFRKSSSAARTSIPMMSGIPTAHVRRLSYGSSSESKENNYMKTPSPKSQNRHSMTHNRSARNPPNRGIITTTQESSIPSGNFPLVRDGSTSSSFVSTVSSSDERSPFSGHYAGVEGDKAISDSEFLIDDEISDQPDLTLTFKDSSLILSPSSSGESLISCDLTLEYKDSSFSGRAAACESELSFESPREPGNNNRGTSFESREMMTAGAPQFSMVNASAYNSRRSLGNNLQGRSGSTSPLTANVQNFTPSSSNKNAKVSNYNNKARVVKSQQQQQQQQQQQNQPNSGRMVLSHQSHSVSGIPRQGKSSGLPAPSSDYEISTVEYSESDINKQQHGSPSHSKLRALTPSKSPSHRIPTSKSTLSKSSPPGRTPFIPSSPESIKYRATTRNEGAMSPNKASPPNEKSETLDEPVVDNFIQFVLTEVSECKNQLNHLISVLETNERELLEKDEIIRKQQKEIDFWKSRCSEEVEKKNFDDEDTEDSIIICKCRGGELRHKEKEVECTHKKETTNSAVQTENNYACKAAVTYPEENDKMGQLVSFRISRMPSTSNKS